MKRQQLQLITLMSAITFQMMGFGSFSLQVLAQSTTAVDNISYSGQLNSIPLEWLNRNPPDFSGDGRPRRTSGGGSRGGCEVENNLPLTALIPNTSMALTVASSPTLWFYVPYTLTAEDFIEFVLKDDQDNYIYKTKFSGKETMPGLVRLSFPSTVTLETHKNYKWYFLIYCDSQNKDKFVFVNGSIQRVERPDLENQLESAIPQERILLYAREGIWYDTLNELATLYQDNPQDNLLREDWAKLLESVGLKELAFKPLGECCAFE